MRYAEWGLCLFAGCVAGWLWGERPDALRELAVINTMTAFGTLGTAVFSAVFAVTTYRQQRRATRYLAQSHAVSSISIIAGLMHESSELVAQITGPVGIQSRPDTSSVKGRLDAMREAMDKIDSASLSVLSPDILAHMRNCHIAISRAKLSVRESGVNLDKCAECLKEFFGHIKSALQECGRVSKLAGPS